ncbi:GNAT family N-acetyltransferase [Kineococcus sp. SYSU DK004]|uniref:GNAT family N-acetyltransferase n=1 Tax=Kineococcus sp. SYSU DK004 TaxID=3383125 RepID=UPI003D7D09DD
MAVRLVTIGAQHWRELRDLRLRMLADTPHAFGDRLERAAAYGDAEWRARAARWQAPGSHATAATELATGRWVGMVGTVVQDDGRLFVVSVFVDPAHRGRAAGTADALLDAELERARERGWSRVHLHVHEDNERARRWYARRGFTETGARVPYLLDVSREEVEMVLNLTAHSQ